MIPPNPSSNETASAALFMPPRLKDCMVVTLSRFRLNKMRATVETEVMDVLMNTRSLTVLRTAAGKEF